MLALREEALQIVNEIPDNLLAEFVQNLRDLKNKFANNAESKKLVLGHSFTEEEWQEFLNSAAEVDPEKEAAFARLEEWRKKNSAILRTIDPEAERMAALEEKYGPFN